VKQLLVFAIILFSMGAYGEDDIRVQIIDGKNFVCFDEVSSRDLFQLRLEYPKLKIKIDLQEEKLSTKQNMILALEDANDSLNQQNNILLTKVGELEGKLESEESWTRSPYLWVTIGVLAGAALSVGIMYAVKN
jgi:hypothetical protein